MAPSNLSSFGIGLSFLSFSRFSGRMAFLDFLFSFLFRRLSRSASESSPESLGGGSGGLLLVSVPVPVCPGFRSSVLGLMSWCSSSGLYDLPVEVLPVPGPLELLSPLIAPNAGCLTVPVVGFGGVNPPMARNGVVCAGSLIYRGRSANRRGTRRVLLPFFR